MDPTVVAAGGPVLGNAHLENDITGNVDGIDRHVLFIFDSMKLNEMNFIRSGK